jgi:hypothetical protein
MLNAVILMLLLQVRFESPGCMAGEGWSFALGARELDSSPRWQESVDEPPLAPRAAIRAARSLLGHMSCKQADSWEVVDVALRPVKGERNVWIYVVKFQEPLALKKGSAVGSVFPRVVDILVLLDGTAVTPSVASWPPRQ